MLLGSPPDMVHGVLLHRARTPIYRICYPCDKNIIAQPHKNCNRQNYFLHFCRIYHEYFVQLLHKFILSLHSIYNIINKIYVKLCKITKLEIPAKKFCKPLVILE